MCKSYPRESKGELLHSAVYSLTASLIMIIIFCRSDDSCSILATFISFSTYKLYETIHSQRFVSTQRGYKIYTSWLQWQQQLLQTFFQRRSPNSSCKKPPGVPSPQRGKLRRDSDWRSARRTLGTRLSGLRKLNYLLSCVNFVVVNDFAEESPCLQILVESPGLLSYWFLLLHCLL